MMIKDYKNAIIDCKKSLQIIHNSKVAKRLSKCYLFIGNLKDCIKILKTDKDLKNQVIFYHLFLVENCRRN